MADQKGSGVDRALLDMLREFGAPATLFLNRRWIDTHPDLTRELIEDSLFRVHNHGTAHVPLSSTGRSAYEIGGTASLAEAAAEVETNMQHVRDKFGTEMTKFRSGTAHYDDVCVDMLTQGGYQVIGFTTNVDAGATAPAGTVTRELLNAPNGAICIGHMNQPSSGTAAGVRAALIELRRRGDTAFVWP
ncbi:polysaccharide deacetylase family protein [Corynebacterium epidermidicanis]|uniref:polysaccharide deacetylase family protein n=1 Tax=Corynebacterium epidermidicanis TaxID=1050174 RepID=UPI001EEDBB15|nr:polysaccharide deacetylase family protein [Corynebacterium epidermidicanis]